MQKPYLVTQLQSPFTSATATTRVLIFKTDIKTMGDKFYMKPFFDKHPLITEWNIDLEDVDCVLRIVTTRLQLTDVIELLAQRGYYAQELA